VYPIEWWHLVVKGGSDLLRRTPIHLVTCYQDRVFAMEMHTHHILALRCHCSETGIHASKHSDLPQRKEDDPFRNELEFNSTIDFLMNSGSAALRHRGNCPRNPAHYSVLGEPTLPAWTENVRRCWGGRFLFGVEPSSCVGLAESPPGCM
jgi:hypothetical protein